MHSSLKRYVDPNGNVFSLNAEDAARLGYKLYEPAKAEPKAEPKAEVPAAMVEEKESKRGEK